MDLAESWRKTFTATIQQPAYARPLQQAFKQGKAAWTKHMTAAVVAACEEMGWQAAAQGFPGKTLPVPRSEYLSIDVTAFSPGNQKWTFPTGVFELENQQDDNYVAYNLWKLLCVKAKLRVLTCYRKKGSDARGLKALLAEEVVGAMPVQERLGLTGSTMVVIGTESAQGAFPYGYFKWWQLEKNTGRFHNM